MLCGPAPRVGVRDSQCTLFCVAPRVGVRDSQSTLCCVAPRVGVRDSQSTLCCIAIFRVFLGKRAKRRFILQKVIRPPPCPNPNPCVPKPKPTQMQSPQSDGSSHPGKHLPQSDGSRHGVVGEAAKVSLHEDVFSAGATSSSTSLVCLHCPLRFYSVDMPTKKAKKTPEEKRLFAGPCHICEKKGCQMACLHCRIAFHPHCDKHDMCPNAPAQDSDAEQDMREVGPSLAPCEGRCGSICGCAEDMCGCRCKFQTPRDDFQRQQRFTGKAHQPWPTAPRS